MKREPRALYRRHTTMAEWEAMRLQLRIAWAALGCRCAFDDKNEKVREDAHCPVHGTYGSVLDPIADYLRDKRERLSDEEQVPLTTEEATTLLNGQWPQNADGLPVGIRSVPNRYGSFSDGGNFNLERVRELNV